jgi:outer membrane receptor protein involved in Fe transport
MIAALSLALALDAATPDTVRLTPLETVADRPTEAPGAQRRLEAEALARIDADLPAGALNSLPAVNIQMNAGVEHLIAVRSPVLTAGAGQASVLILEDGVAIRPAAFGNVNALFEAPLELAAGLEVVAGPGSVRHGSNAQHGLINVALPDPAEGPRATGRVSVSTLGRTRVEATARGETGGWQAWAGFASLLDGGWRTADSVSQHKLSAVATTNAGPWALRASLSAIQLEQETAGFIEGADAWRDRELSRSNPTPEAFRDARAVRAALRASRAVAGGTLTVIPHARWQDMELSQHFLPYGGTEENDSRSIGLLTRWEGADTGPIRWAVGLDLDGASGSLKEVQTRPSFGAFPQGTHYDYTVETRQLGLWAEGTLAVSERLILTAGLRAEQIDYRHRTAFAPGTCGRFRVVADRRDSYDSLVPRIGVGFQPAPDWTLFAQAARGARMPQATDLYRLQNRQTPGEVRVETLDSLEAGLRWSGARGGFEAVVWTQDKTNWFFRDADGLNVPDGATTARGVEVTGRWQATETLNLSANVAWARHLYDFTRRVARAEEVIAAGTPVDTAPAWLWDASAVWTPTPGLEASLNLAHTGAYAMDAANTATYPGHTLADVRLSVALSPAAQAFAHVRNLADTDYASRADLAFGVPRFFPGEPRSLTVGLKWRG